MPLPTVTISASERLVIIRFSGAVTLETFLEGREALKAERGWTPSYAHVFDFTDITDIDLSRAAIEALAAAPPVFDRAAPQILVARAGTFEYSLVRTFEALAAGRRIVHVVGSMPEARDLLAKLRG
jgi:hypothetical protein